MTFKTISLFLFVSIFVLAVLFILTLENNKSKIRITLVRGEKAFYGEDIYEKGEIFIDLLEVQTNEFQHFWKSSGLCPPDPHEKASDFLLGRDMALNIALLGSLPHRGLRQLRVHWLLYLLEMDPSGPTFNFAELDQFLKLLQDFNLDPGFELMGNPSKVFTDLKDPSQLMLWQRMVAELARHYLELYGKDRVAAWNFESWNEPNGREYNIFNFTVESYLRYYEASYAGLKSASPALKIGGPGTKCDPRYPQSFCWQLLRRAPLDFISIHQKGDGSSLNILHRELQFVEILKKNFTSLANTPLYNDEADPLVNWAQAQDWRGDATYAAIVVKIVCQHVREVLIKKPEVPYSLLSNDNGFLSYFPHQFTQRTLLARFQVNDTQPPFTVMVPKPVYSAMGLLARLGQHLLHPLRTFTDGDFLDIAATLTTSQTSRQMEVVLVVSQSNDTAPKIANVTTTLKLNLYHPHHKKMGQLRYVVLMVDEETDPYREWQDMGEPPFPTLEQFDRLQQVWSPRLAVPPEPLIPSSQLNIDLPPLTLPGVLLVHICNRRMPFPSQVTELKVLRVSPQILLLTWRDNTRCLWRYEVEFSPDGTMPFYKAHTSSVVIFPHLYLFGHANNPSGFYRVQAIDFWNRKGAFSQPVQSPT